MTTQTVTHCPRCKAALKRYEDGDMECPACFWAPEAQKREVNRMIEKMKVDVPAPPTPILQPFEAHLKAQEELLKSLTISLEAKRRAVAKMQTEIGTLEAQVRLLTASLKELGRPVKTEKRKVVWSPEARAAQAERARKMNEAKAAKRAEATDATV